MTHSGASTPGGNDELDDPGRDPVGLNPPRNILDAPGGTGTDHGEYSPGRTSAAQEQADQRPDEPPTGTGTGGP